MISSSELAKFVTGYIVSAADADQLHGLGVPGEWSLETTPDPSLRHSEDISSRGSTQAISVHPDSKRHRGMRPMRAIVIRARSMDEAINVSTLLHAGALLAYPEWGSNPVVGRPLDEAFIATGLAATRGFYERFHLYDTRMPFAARVAARAWREQALLHAVHKFRFGLATTSCSVGSVNPRYGQIFENEYEEHEDQVSAAMAISAAFSCVEELGLQLRSSKERPRFIGDAFNPNVLNDLNERLRAANMRADLKIEWVRRGVPTPLELDAENNRTPGKSSEFARRADVRDLSLTLAEGLHRLSWLRNFHTGHRFTELTKTLSPYDVFNCQNAARRVVLGALNLWTGPDGT